MTARAGKAFLFTAIDLSVDIGSGAKHGSLIIDYTGRFYLPIGRGLIKRAKYNTAKL